MHDLDGNFELEFERGHQFSYEKLPSMKKLKHRNVTTVDKPYIGGKLEDIVIIENFQKFSEYD